LSCADRARLRMSGLAERDDMGDSIAVWANGWKV
jgi:hypothetical protein